MCHQSQVKCHLSPTTTATSTDPPPTNSPTMHIKLVCKNQKPKTDTLFDQKSPSLLVPVGDEGDKQITHKIQTDITTYRLNWPRGRFRENAHLFLARLLVFEQKTILLKDLTSIKTKAF